MKTPKALASINMAILSIFLMPVFYMVWRFFTFTRSFESFFESWNVYGLLFNTISMFFAVVISSLVLGLLISIILIRFKITGSKILFTLCTLPLVIPSYIAALTYI